MKKQTILNIIESALTNDKSMLINHCKDLAFEAKLDGLIDLNIEITLLIRKHSKMGWNK